MILTANEKRMLRLLATTGKPQSMNQLGKACGVSSGGAYKILTKLEKEGVLKATAIANLKAYKLYFGEYVHSTIKSKSLRLSSLKPQRDGSYGDVASAIPTAGISKVLCTYVERGVFR